MKSDGSSASYYDFPEDANTLGELMDSQNMCNHRRELFISMLRYSFELHNIKWEDVELLQSKKLQHLISQANMNFQIGECFKALYRFGKADHSGIVRDLNKIDFYLNAEIERITKWSNASNFYKIPEINHMLETNSVLLDLYKPKAEKPDSSDAKS